MAICGREDVSGAEVADEKCGKEEIGKGGVKEKRDKGMRKSVRRGICERHLFERQMRRTGVEGGSSVPDVVSGDAEAGRAIAAKPTKLRRSSSEGHAGTRRHRRTDGMGTRGGRSSR